MSESRKAELFQQLIDLYLSAAGCHQLSTDLDTSVVGRRMKEWLTSKYEEMERHVLDTDHEYISIYDYPGKDDPKKLLKFQIAVMEAAQSGMKVEYYCLGRLRWVPFNTPDGLPKEWDWSVMMKICRPERKGVSK